MYPELKEKMMNQLNNDEELRELTNGAKFEIFHYEGEFEVLWFINPRKFINYIEAVVHFAMNYNVIVYCSRYRRNSEGLIERGIEFKLA